MPLVLSRKKGEVINLDDEIFIELYEKLSKNSLSIYVYNKLIDKEFNYEIFLNESFDLKWFSGCSKKAVIYFIKNKPSKGKNVFKILIDADKSIFIKREYNIKYNNFIDNVNSNLFDDNILLCDSFDEYDNFSKPINFSNDKLLEKYKDELSWFYQ